MKDRFKGIKEEINHIKEFVEKHSANIVVLLVINTDTKAEIKNDYEQFSVESEYFSEKELEEVKNGFEALGCEVDFSNGEKEFMEKLANNRFEKYGSKKKIVYHSTGSGTGKCRSALTPAICNAFHLENCSNDVYTSVIAENKIHFFHLLEYYGFSFPKTWYYDNKDIWLRGEPKKNLKLIAKPAYESSSIGVSEESVSEYTPKFKKHIKELARALRQPVIVQEFIEGDEVEVPLFDIGKPFAPMSVGIKMNGKKNPGENFLTYQMVNEDNYDFFSFCKENPALGKKLRQTACDSFSRLNLNGMLRVDFRVKPNGKFFIMDYNNTPHLTEFHSCAYSITNLGFNYSDMFALLLYKHI